MYGFRKSNLDNLTQVIEPFQNTSNCFFSHSLFVKNNPTQIVDIKRKAQEKDLVEKSDNDNTPIVEKLLKRVTYLEDQLDSSLKHARLISFELEQMKCNQMRLEQVK